MTAPERIWADFVTLHDQLATFYCQDGPYQGGIEYIRADLAAVQPAAIREAALREAAEAVITAKVFSESDSDGESAAKVIALGRAHKAILALIGEKK